MRDCQIERARSVCSVEAFKAIVEVASEIAPGVFALVLLVLYIKWSHR